MTKSLQQLKDAGEAAQWMEKAGFKTISGGYLLKEESPKGMYRRVARSAALSGNFSDDLKHDFFEIMWDNWLCPASPVLSNLGTDRGLPISCFGIDIDDRMEDIMGRGIGELAMLTKHGGGVGVSLNRLRESGSPIKGGKNGKSDGIIPFAKTFDSAILSTKQGETRRGAASINLSIEHGDFDEFVRMRRPEGDINRQCGNIHHAALVSDEFMHRIKNGDIAARYSWTSLMKSRMETGEPYVVYIDTINKNNPDAYKNNGLEVSMTNICSEIALYTDPDHSFICCLSSLNLSRYDEWKDYKSPRTGLTVPQIATYFLNGVLDEFIEKAKYLPYFERTVRSAEKGRAIGIGVLGWHDLLQSKGLGFASFKTMQLNNEIHKFIKEESELASRELATQRGEPEWCKGTDMYNSHLLAIAPTRSNSIISNVTGAGVEPIAANVFTNNAAKGTFIVKNKYLEKVLEKYGKNEDSVWKDIDSKEGSVQHLDFLSDDEKEVFKTAYEIDQKTIIQQAAQRQKYVCQAQSLNLFFPADVDAKYFNDVHLLAWELGVKTLYYCKSTAGIKADSIDRDDGCSSCEG